MRQLNPKAVWLFFISYFWRSIFISVILGSYLGAFLPDKNIATPRQFFWESISQFVYVILFLVFIGIIFSYIWARLSYYFYRYEIKEDGFRKEFGVIWKKYVTIPYDRIQNVDIYRGILARIFGLSDLNIQTAGASGQVSKAEGRLPGLSREDAEQLRDELIRQARQSKNQGL